ncbi:hypothetical protein FYA67_15775 [Bordetella holmesii]|nr:hypothetical protein [Bordetella holmesii]AMD47253.1 hypothetical protein H558_03645 [Bordetella holmesii H558]AOB37374.1 hypothetical protein BBB42_15450 [Bordetella holmesii]AUL24054.1 hypothetical protein BTL48_15575 [Bordetella holmesii]AUL27991.1 hypothetical protein BTL49_15645 [Bordetella holmesii]AUL31330.1 hypothetical protein BTL50_15640 [Bordetella holmesii]
MLFGTVAQAQTQGRLTGPAAAGVPPVSAPSVAPPPSDGAAPPVVRQIDVAAPGVSASAPAAPAATSTDLAQENPGDVTRALMQAQADGRRYLKSFDQPLPQWFDSSSTSGKSGSGGGLGAGQ